VGIKEDVLRTLEYGKTPYYNAIRAVPSYQAELARVRADYNERTWIDFKGFWPKFTTAEFERRRTAYQARYGNKVNIPGFSDVIHIIPKARISAEERAAHLWATKRGLPSPLTAAQLESLQYKKFRFLKALASLTPTWMKNYGAVATVLDNVEDALVTITFLGKIAIKISSRHFQLLVPKIGWLLLGSDILNALNMFAFVTFSAMKAKRNIEDLGAKNPFHWKSKAKRIDKLRRLIPSFGENLEILQTTDQLFGLGLCLGGLMGIVTDLSSSVLSTPKYNPFARIPKNPNANELTRFAYNTQGVRQKEFREALGDMWKEFKREDYRQYEFNTKQREELFNIMDKNKGIIWDKIKSIPEAFLKDFSKSVIGSMIMSTGKDDFLKEDHTKAYMMLDASIQGLMPWWIENDPLEAFNDIRTFEFRAPAPTDPSTIDMLNEHDPDWQNTVKWPHLDKEYATIEEIAFTYAPMIKDSFQTYALNYRHEYSAMIAAQQIVEFTKNVIRSYSDDHEVIGGMTAWWAAAEDMAREIYLIPPDTSKELIDSLADYIGNYERATGGAPSIHEVARQGEALGIQWMRTFPARAFNQAAEIFPEWQTIQDQLDDLFVAD